MIGVSNKAPGRFSVFSCEMSETEYSWEIGATVFSHDKSDGDYGYDQPPAHTYLCRKF